jgi:hypothetical protein
MTAPTLTYRVTQLYERPIDFTEFAGRLHLRPYQSPVVQAIVESIRRKLGLSFVVIFPRQSGKNETQAALYVYLLKAFRKVGGDVIHVEPTFKPQTIIAMQRLEKRLSQNILSRNHWRRVAGYQYGIGNARVIHYSGDLSANVVGATASLLLSVNEAQDVNIQKFDKDFNPMAASTNATRVFWGTRWTDDTLLERELKAARAAEAIDNIQRVFFVTADDVGAVLPAYRTFVQNEIVRLGRQHPLVRTQYYCETITAAAGMFPPARIALMRGSHPRQETPTAGKSYAFLVDVAGQDEKTVNMLSLDNPARDSTALTIVEIDLAHLAGSNLPHYKTICRYDWTGEKHTTVHAQISKLAELWGIQYGIIDATGVGEGLWSLLDQSQPFRWIPVKFSAVEKSDIGYQFIQIVETGRYSEYSPLHDVLLTQLEKCRSEVRPGPSKLLSWGVPDGLRDDTGQFLHDDLLVSASLCAILDRMQWTVSSENETVEQFDPLLRRMEF